MATRGPDVIAPVYQRDGVELFQADALEVLAQLADGSADLVVCDPPYGGVIENGWDNAWPDRSAYLAWFDQVLEQLERVLSRRGTLYLFAWPRFAAELEVQLATRFRVIGSCVWDKGDGVRGGVGGKAPDVGALRTYWPTSERCIVAEDREAERDYLEALKAAGRASFGAYLEAEIRRAGQSPTQVADLFPSRTGGRTGCVSNWTTGAGFPLPEQYAAIRARLRETCPDALERDHGQARAAWAESTAAVDRGLRRPFQAQPGRAWGDVWRFAPPRGPARVHPCEKPLALIRQLVDFSSEPGDLVLDPFAGSGVTLRAALDAGRRAIGIERAQEYSSLIPGRLAQGALPFEAAAP